MVRGGLLLFCRRCRGLLFFRDQCEKWGCRGRVVVWVMGMVANIVIASCISGCGMGCVMGCGVHFLLDGEKHELSIHDFMIVLI